MTARAPGFNY